MNTAEHIRLRAGPFYDASKTFLYRLNQSGINRDLIPQSFDAPQLGRLARYLKHLRNPRLQAGSVLDDDSVIEGGGAFLAMTLLHHMPDARHAQRDDQHRLRLGTVGFLNPFEAIHVALHADDPKGVLVEALTLAERERRGVGPIASTVVAFGRALTQSYPSWQWVDSFDAKVRIAHPRLGEYDVNLSQLVALSSDGALETWHFDTVLGRLPREHSSESHQASAGVALDFKNMIRCLAPRLIGPNAFEKMHLDALLTLRWTPGLAEGVRMGFGLASGKHFRWITRHEAQGWKQNESFDTPHLFSLAMEHLIARSEKLRIRKWNDFCVMVQQGDGFDATRVVLPQLWQQAVEYMGGPCYLAIPHRDVILISRHHEHLQQECHAQFRRAPQPLSSRIFFTHGDELRPSWPH